MTDDATTMLIAEYAAVVRERDLARADAERLAELVRQGLAHVGPTSESSLNMDHRWWRSHAAQLLATHDAAAKGAT